MRGAAVTLASLALGASSAQAAATTVVSAAVPGPSAAFSEVTVVADCGGRTASGGGARLDQSAQAVLHNGLRVYGNVPLDASRWLGAGGGGGAVPSDALTVAYALCLDTPLSTTIVTASARGPSGTFQEQRTTVTCPDGTSLLSGGARTTPGTVGSLKPRASYPSDAVGTPVLGGPAPRSWTAVGLNGGGGDQRNTTHVFAVCAADSPPVTVVHTQVPGPARASSAAQSTASCPAGTTLLGGGASISDAFALPGSQGDHLTGSYPSTPAGLPVATGAATSWTAATHTGGVDSGNLTHTDAWALCASAPETTPVPATPAPTNVTPPSISGAALAGRLLSAVAGRWSVPVSPRYEWLRCDTLCARVAEGSHYRLTATDIGSRLRVRETADDVGVASSATGWVQGRPSTRAIKSELGRRLVPHGRPARIDALLAAGALTLPLKALAAGRADVRWDTASGVTIARGTRAFRDGRTGTIRIRLTTTGRRELRRADSVRVTSAATFTRRGRKELRATRRFLLERGAGVTAAQAPGAVFRRVFGGAGEDAVRAIAVDREGSTYITGETSSRDLPVTLGGANRGQPISAFVAKLDRAGEVVYARYLGGTRYTSGRGIAVDRQGRAHVVGATSSTDFPVTGAALQRSYGGGPFDAFYARLKADGTLDYATFLGDTHYDDANAVAVDADNRAVLTGRTVSPGFPIRGNLRPAVAGGAFVAAIEGRKLVYSTVLGGNDRGNHGNAGFAVAIDRRGTAYVTGVTNATRFPRVAALQPRIAGGGDAFVAAIDARQVRVSTYLGRPGDDVGRAIAVSKTGSVYVAGLSGGATFLARLAPGARRLASWQRLDGTGGFGIALDRDGRPRVATEGLIATGPAGDLRRAHSAGGNAVIEG